MSRGPGTFVLIMTPSIRSWLQPSFITSLLHSPARHSTAHPSAARMGLEHSIYKLASRFLSNDKSAKAGNLCETEGIHRHHCTGFYLRCTTPGLSGMTWPLESPALTIQSHRQCTGWPEVYIFLHLRFLPSARTLLRDHIFDYSCTDRPDRCFPPPASTFTTLTGQ